MSLADLVNTAADAADNLSQYKWPDQLVPTGLQFGGTELNKPLVPLRRALESGLLAASVASVADEGLLVLLRESESVRLAAFAECPASSAEGARLKHALSLVRRDSVGFVGALVGWKALIRELWESTAEALVVFCWSAANDLANRKKRLVKSVAKLRSLASSLQRKPHLSKKEAEKRIGKYLRTHRTRAAKGEIHIPELVRETGVPKSSISGLECLTRLQDELEERGLSRRPRKKTAQPYTSKMDDVVEDAQLKELIGEQRRDDEPSPLDKGRRGKVRCRKKF
jgi:hypothetical protein